MNRIFITVNGIEHELNPDDFFSVLNLLQDNKNFDCYIDIRDNTISLEWPDANECTYMCIFFDN